MDNGAARACALKVLVATAPRPNDTGRTTVTHHLVGHIFQNGIAGADHRVATDPHVMNDARTKADRRALSDSDAAPGGRARRDGDVVRERVVVIVRSVGV